MILYKDKKYFFQLIPKNFLKNTQVAFNFFYFYVMSIIIGLIRDNFGLVASDGRIFPPVDYENGKPKALVMPRDDNSDKTFSLNEGKVIGAYCGNMEFLGKSISEHLTEIYATECNGTTLWSERLSNLYLHLKTRLESPDCEILFQFRGLNLILISSETGKSKDLKIYWAAFKPVNNKIIIDQNILPSSAKITGTYYWKIFGDDNSQPFVNKYLYESTKLPSPFVTKRLLESKLRNSISTGIEHSLPPVFSTEKSCGGTTFTRTI